MEASGVSVDQLEHLEQTIASRGDRPGRSQPGNIGTAAPQRGCNDGQNAYFAARFDDDPGGACTIASGRVSTHTVLKAALYRAV